MTRKYFPNNYDRIAKAPASYFDSLPYDIFMDWKMNGWELPASHDCIIRTINCKTGKVKEYVYQQHKSAKKKVAKLIVEQEEEFIIASHDFIQHMKPYEYLTENEKKQIDPQWWRLYVSQTSTRYAWHEPPSLRGNRKTPTRTDKRWAIRQI